MKRPNRYLFENFAVKNTDNRAFQKTSITPSGLFENEIGPGVLQFSFQQTRLLQEYRRHETYAADNVSFLFLFYELSADYMFVELWTGAF